MEVKEKEPVGITEVNEADTMFAERKKRNEEQLALEKEVMRKLSEQKKKEKAMDEPEEDIETLRREFTNTVSRIMYEAPAENEKAYKLFLAFVMEALMQLKFKPEATVHEIIHYIIEYIVMYESFLDNITGCHLRELRYLISSSIEPFKIHCTNKIELEDKINKLKRR